MSDELHPNTVRALSVIIQRTTDNLSDERRVLFLLQCAHAEYRQMDKGKRDFEQLAADAAKTIMQNYNYDTDL